MQKTQEKVIAASQGELREQCLIITIAECHIQRIGWMRTLLGGLSMYLSIPVWILIHLTTATFLYQKVFSRLFRLPTVPWKEHVIIDRQRIEGLYFMDKLNCMFCAYANGLTTMINREVDEMARFQGEIGLMRFLLAGLATLFFIPVLLVSELFGIQIVYNICVAPPLGLHRTSYFEVEKMLQNSDYAIQFPPFSRSVLLFAKNTFLRLSMLLEQIESSWCPLKHLDQGKNIIHPEHHRKFFRPDQLVEMRKELLSSGTVSDKKPLY